MDLGQNVDVLLSACLRRPDAISTRAEALQNSMVNKHHAYGWVFFWERSRCSGSQHTCLRKGVAADGEEKAGLGVTRLGCTVGAVFLAEVSLC